MILCAEENAAVPEIVDPAVADVVDPDYFAIGENRSKGCLAALARAFYSLVRAEDKTPDPLVRDIGAYEILRYVTYGNAGGYLAAIVTAETVRYYIVSVSGNIAVLVYRSAAQTGVAVKIDLHISI